MEIGPGSLIIASDWPGPVIGWRNGVIDGDWDDNWNDLHGAVVQVAADYQPHS